MTINFDSCWKSHFSSCAKGASTYKKVTFNVFNLHLFQMMKSNRFETYLTDGTGCVP